MALRIRKNQDRNRYREIIACVLEEAKRHRPQDHGKATPEKSASSKSEVQ